MKDIPANGTKPSIPTEQINKFLNETLPQDFPNLYEYLQWIYKNDGANACDCCSSLVVLLFEKNYDWS